VNKISFSGFVATPDGDRGLTYVDGYFGLAGARRDSCRLSASGNWSNRVYYFVPPAASLAVAGTSRLRGERETLRVR